MAQLDSQTRRILEEISDEKWLAHYHELVLYARWKCSRWLWRTGSRHNLPRGHSPETLASEAVARLLDGQREWNHERYPGDNPVPFLKGVVDSLVSELGHSDDHRQTADAVEDSPRALNAETNVYSPRDLSPAQLAYLEEVDRRVRHLIADREDLVEVYGYLREGHKAAEIAEALGLDVSAVYVRIRAFVRRTKAVYAEAMGELATTRQGF